MKYVQTKNTIREIIIEKASYLLIILAAVTLFYGIFSFYTKKDLQSIAVFISALASLISALMAVITLKFSKESFRNSFAPLVTLEIVNNLFYLRNVGKGLAKNIIVSVSKAVRVTKSSWQQILLPCENEEEFIKSTLQHGGYKRSSTPSLYCYIELDTGKEGHITIEYEDIFNQKYQSILKIKCFNKANLEYEIEFIHYKKL